MPATWNKLAYDTEVVKHSLATAASDFLVASGAGAYVKKSLAETKVILGLGTLGTYAVGDLIYATSTSALGQLPDVAVGSVLISGGVGAVPAWSAIPQITQLDARPAVNTASLGADLVQNGDFATDTGWAGTNWAFGTGAAVHTTGANTLTKTLALTSGAYYQVIFDINTTTVGTVQVKLGTAIALAGVLWGHKVEALTTQQVVIQANGNDLLFVPSAAWEGIIDNVTVKLITTTTSGIAIKNAAAAGIELRAGSNFYNTYVGFNSGLCQNTATYSNTGIGYGALQGNTTGASNTAVGASALSNNTKSSFNVAVGTSALANNTGAWNNAVGAQALYVNTTGYQNNAQGYQALCVNTVGYYNCGIGSVALGLNTTGYGNTAVGTFAGYKLTVGNDNTFIGNSAGNNAVQKVDAVNSTAIGANAYTTASNQVVIGAVSITETLLRGNIGINVTAFGTSAAQVLGIGSGTAPTTSPADMAQMWVQDVNAAAGYAGLHKRTETTNQVEIVPGVIIKTNTGSPANPYEGLMEINTYDNKIRMYADAGWRDCAAW